jgi:hypothetical protein
MEPAGAERHRREARTDERAGAIKLTAYQIRAIRAIRG